ncbi:MULTISPECIES: ROK family transcriptional regulator [unclassified Paenibacillus]|uniref:ROK family transcriptional regulator n=1 Tax=unclassified Paenibacillus TaxID=185978 RepID=UPI002474467F|nr:MULTISPECIES: ROK family transcriptional regulator [unclassified Paenibacillus]MDH6430370.1 putative NBD/HSP70 family sugar kinase [Paenibacillus sp. PastH-4]MDH6446961.1 putative NBD/HSP70 family sugar kinase [Paenibacillus sp. PastF-4]MDH6530762.1 putative NBD/HSP70 family sugar kinase [Paenibacillus sp. PastH-3]
MKVTGDQALVKKINKSIVLHTIRRNSPLSRAKVSEMTGLNKATVSNLVAELCAQELVTEVGPGQSSGGRKPLMLHFNSMAGSVIGIELRVKQLTAVLCDLSGGILFESDFSLDNHALPYVLERMKKTISELIDKAPESPYGIVGIGVGVPGMVDENGVVLFAPNLGWEMVDLRGILEAEFAVPVTIDNEANAGAQGELNFGAAKDVRHLLYISAGSGIGSGIIIGGELYKGARGYAGETGHMTIEAQGKPCSCGSRGCWELYASEKTYDHSEFSLPAHTTQELVRYAAAGQEDALRHFSSMGEYLGIGVTNLINSFNPELIVIGGALSEAEAWLGEPLRRVVAERTLPYHKQQLEITFSKLGSRGTMIGAGFSAVMHFLGDIRVTV